MQVTAAVQGGLVFNFIYCFYKYSKHEMQQYTDGTKLPGICKQLRQKKTSLFSIINWRLKEEMRLLSMHNGVTVKGEKRTGGARAGASPHRDTLAMGSVRRLFPASVAMTGTASV